MSSYLFLLYFIFLYICFLIIKFNFLQDTKIHVILFNNYIKKCNDVNPNFLSVNNEIEVGLNDNTIVQECNNHFSTVTLLNRIIYQFEIYNFFSKFLYYYTNTSFKYYLCYF